MERNELRGEEEEEDEGEGEEEEEEEEEELCFSVDELTKEKLLHVWHQWSRQTINRPNE